MKFAVNTDCILGRMPTVQAIGKVRECGLDGIEMWAWNDRDLKPIAAEARRLGVEIAALPTTFWILVDPARRAEYLAGLRESLEAAKFCGTPVLMSQVGNDNGRPREEQHASIVAGLRECAPLCEAAGVTLAIEPLNLLYDHAGYYLHSSLEAFEIVREVASPNIKVLYDIYHQQITEGNLANNLANNVAEIAHVHVAGHPGRHEPDNGEINAPFLYATLDRAGYKGRIGLEYMPVRDPMEYLHFLARIAGTGKS